MVTRIRFLVYMKYEKSRGQWTCKQYLTEVVPHVVLASEIDTQYAGDILVYIYSLDHAPYLKAEVTDAYGNYIYNNTADYYIYVCAVRDDSENNGSKEPEAELHTPDLPSGSESTEDKN
ncbi:hypothetical protein GWI33_002859 [Rhynchophorus ferrugineus]|uniref:Uncharacterized protein n=1 Tax=Rhynchophorus ferrugineus TaxID=354439 RepID=A0A834MPA1_RHYFE|nr:hypothetical protein GWI33_002859 [Rhynchophorus ferrugineus]